MNYSFDKQHAIIYGVDEAIMLHNMIFWIEKNRANNKHFYEGRYWTYNSVEAFKQLFGFWTPKQLRRIIESLVNQGIIMRGNFNKSNMDRTGWYALVNQDAFLGIVDLPITANASDEKGKAIPYNKTDIKGVTSNTGSFDFISEVRTEVKDQKRKFFIKPNFDEVCSHFKELGYPNLAPEFFNHYTSNGWMVGKTGMKNWHAAAGNWVARFVEKNKGNIGGVNDMMNNFNDI